MSVTKLETSLNSLSYTPKTLARAIRALSCAPFKLELFLAMNANSIPLPLMAGKLGLDNHYSLKFLSENAVDFELGWLIQVGLLRREVDGQGITDSFRLTPLGKQIVRKYAENEGKIPSPSLWNRIINFFSRYFRFPLSS